MWEENQKQAPTHIFKESVQAVEVNFQFKALKCGFSSKSKKIAPRQPKDEPW